MKRLRFYYQGIVIDKNSELLINEPRRYKMITEKNPITDIEDFMKNKFGMEYKYLKYLCEFHARKNAIILDAIINGPIEGDGFEEDNNSYI
jgi:hypothetical protein